tara:strand:- start:1463 stop:1972 length:510 start_codon:yes stop_codon:yes gene_type:complete
MESKIQEVYVCQQARTEDLNKRMYDRNLASRQMTPKYFSRPIDNSRTVMPTLDSRRKTCVKKANFSDYNMENDFSPGVGGPYNGYSNNVDKESLLFNKFNVLQKCPQVFFVPDSKSDLFNSSVPVSRGNQPFSLLQKEPVMTPFNPDECGLGTDLFFNHTRQQLKDVKI